MEEEPIEIFGYHGTSRESAEQILRDGFEIRSKPWDWLGDGVYFWQDAPRRASLWGEEWTTGGARSAEVSVVKARLSLEDCIDLLDVGWNEVLEETVGLFQERLLRSGRKLENKSRGRHMWDAAFFNFLVGQLESSGIKVGSIRAAIAEGKALQRGSPIQYRSHVQVAVRDLSLITDLEIL